MRLLLIRHATAHERDADRWPNDDLRPLTGRGRRRFAQLLDAIDPAAFRPRRLLSSRFNRAWETAGIVSSRWTTPAPEAEPALEAGGSDAIIALVRTLAVRGADECVALVGHEPDLSACMTRLLTGASDRTSLRVRKGAIIALEVGEEPGPGTSMLHWVIHPGLLDRG